MLTGRRRYDEMKNLYVNKLATAWINDSAAETTRVSFDKKIDSFVKGDLEHATEMLSTLWEIINKNGDMTVPLNISPTVRLFLPCLPVLRGNVYFT